LYARSERAQADSGLKPSGTLVTAVAAAAAVVPGYILPLFLVLLTSQAIANKNLNNKKKYSD